MGSTSGIAMIVTVLLLVIVGVLIVAVLILLLIIVVTAGQVVWIVRVSVVITAGFRLVTGEQWHLTKTGSENTYDSS